MQTITLKISDDIFDKFKWLISHFSKNEIDIVSDIETSKLSPKEFDYISDKQMLELKKVSNEYKKGNTEDFEEYILKWVIN